MKKSVKYNNDTIKVDFESKNTTRLINRMEGIRIADAHGTKDFYINDKKYIINWDMKYKNTHSVTLSFEGFICGDSEKKMIEFIISKYGI